MELQNTGKYECRSLLNCFSGGTVYDTSIRYNNSAHNKSVLKNPINKKIQIKVKNESLIDSTTHLDDDMFNDYIERSKVMYQSQSYSNNMVNNFFKQQKPIGFECYSSQSTQIYASMLSDSVMKNSSASFNCLPQTRIVNDSICCFSNVNRNAENKSFLVEADTTQDEIYSQFSPLVNTADSNASSDLSWQESIEPSFSSLPSTEFTCTSRLTHKRKQTYIIRNDLFLEMPNEDFEVLNKITLSSKCKRRKPMQDKGNKNEVVLYQNEKLPEQIKINGSLKNRRASYVNNNNIKNPYNAENKIISNERNIYTNPNNNFSLNNNNSINEGAKNNKNSVVFISFNELKIDKEFTQPNYFDYVQPIEKIESDLDKLIFPIIEVEIPQTVEVSPIQLSSMMKDFNRNETCLQNKQNKVDLKLMVSSNEYNAEKDFFSKSVLAKKLGFQNIFNTSNDFVMNEVFFDEAYKKIKLDVCWQGNKVIAGSCQFVNKSFKSVSLMESLNELKRFGGFTEENDKKKPNDNEGDCQITVDESIKSSECNRQRDKFNDSFNSNSLNDSNLTDDHLSEETITCSETETQKSSISIKIKIKRISNDSKNEYIIDDSMKLNKKKKEVKFLNKILKDNERYECADCLEKFRIKKMLISHISAYHKGPYDSECEICHMKFKKSSAHKPHLPGCERYKKFKCHLCTKEYCYNASLKKHLKVHFKNE